MTKARSAAFAVLLTVAITPAASVAAEIKLLCAAALRPTFSELLPQFEKATGHRVSVVYANVGSLTDRLKKRESADVAIVTDIQIDELQELEKVLPGTRLDIAKVGVGAFVRKNSPMPDINSVDAFKRTMLATTTITYADPALGGAAGIYMGLLMDRLGISLEMTQKTKLSPGTLLYQVVANGEADLGFDQISLILEQSIVELVGPLPALIQNYTTFTAAIGATSTGDQAAAGKAFIAFLASPSAQTRMKAKGFESRRN